MYAVIAHCKHSAPIGPCVYCLGLNDPARSQPRTVATFDDPRSARFSAANRAGRQPVWSGIAFTVVEV